MTPLCSYTYTNLSILLFCCLTTVTKCLGTARTATETKQVWDYVKVRDDAYMFWWLYFTQATGDYRNKPLVMWLQGGPGASSTGYGNFNEIGPEDIDQTPRSTTWLSQASLLFVDNPVGTGFSYVTSESAYTRNDDDIAQDLLTMMKSFLGKIRDFQKVPFYIFSESYGGKMTAAFSQALYNAIKNGDIQCNFKGFAMGDSWISPVDSVLTWGPYLHSTSLVDKEGLGRINTQANKCAAAVSAGEWTEATEAWNELETVVETNSNGVNFYNILKWEGNAESSAKAKTIRPNEDKMNPKTKKLYQTHAKVHDDASLSQYMNGPVRQKLKIIPSNVTWGGQSGDVFEALSGDFMKNVTYIVDNMLMTDLKVVVYSGQLDLIVDTVGTEQWVQRLKWPYLDGYNSARRVPFYTGEQKPANMAGFVKTYRNFSFYWVLNAGHMIPADAGEAALKMLDMIMN